MVLSSKTTALKEREIEREGKGKGNVFVLFWATRLFQNVDNKKKIGYKKHFWKTSFFTRFFEKLPQIADLLVGQ